MGEASAAEESKFRSRKTRAVAIGLALATLSSGLAYALQQSWLPIFVGTRLSGSTAVWYGNGATLTDCGGDHPALSGISVTAAQSCGWFTCSTEYMHKALCGAPSSVQAANTAPATLNIATGDHRIDWSTQHWDWAPNLIKGECRSNQMVTGLATEPSPAGDGRYNLLGVQCKDIVGSFGAVNCTAFDFRHFDVRESSENGDWDPNFIKGQCGVGRIMKGVAHGGGRPVAMLCCTPWFTPPGNPD